MRDYAEMRRVSTSFAGADADIVEGSSQVMRISRMQSRHEARSDGDNLTLTTSDGSRVKLFISTIWEAPTVLVSLTICQTVHMAACVANFVAAFRITLLLNCTF
jgi:hypothetical protein